MKCKIVPLKQSILSFCSYSKLDLDLLVDKEMICSSIVISSETFQWTSKSLGRVESPGFKASEPLPWEAHLSPGHDWGQFPGRAKWTSHLALSVEQPRLSEVDTEWVLSVPLTPIEGSGSPLTLASTSPMIFLSSSGASGLIAKEPQHHAGNWDAGGSWAVMQPWLLEGDLGFSVWKEHQHTCSALHGH